MKIAVYPGSFNPWHAGHEEIVTKAASTFDRLIIAIAQNPEKGTGEYVSEAQMRDSIGHLKNVTIDSFSGLLADYAKERQAAAIVRGLRNSIDFETEKTQQYWNEDLGLTCPTVYFISHRERVHISSSAIRQVNKITKTS